MDHPSFCFFFLPHQSSKSLTVVVMAAFNQLGGNVLESHRRYWHCSKTGAVSDPAAMAFPTPQWKCILSSINSFSLLINTLFTTSILFPLVFPVPQQCSCQKCHMVASLMFKAAFRLHELRPDLQIAELVDKLLIGNEFLSNQCLKVLTVIYYSVVLKRLANTFPSHF